MAQTKQPQQKHEATAPSPPEIDPEAMIGDLTVGQLLHVLGASSTKAPVRADAKVETLTLGELLQILRGLSPQRPAPGLLQSS